MLTRSICQHTPSEINNSVNIVIMDQAIAILESPSTSCVSVIARKHGLVPSTLRRQWKGTTTDRSQAIEDSRFLDNQQEAQLLMHIKKHCDRCLPPTLAIVAEIAAHLGGRAPGGNWCS